jgi:outer membrane protein TolC
VRLLRAVAVEESAETIPTRSASRESKKLKYVSAVLETCTVLLWAATLVQGSALAQVTDLNPLPAAGAAQPTGTPMHLSLQDAIRRANALSPAMETALTNAKIAAEFITQSRAAILPAITANTQYLYTEGNGTSAARYIANNGVHEYIAQGDAHEVLSVPLLIAHRRSVVLASLARDEAEIAQRGLVVTVVESYATLVAANGKLDNAKETLDAARQFLKVTQELEKGGEVADADVVKAQIQVSDSDVTFRSAQLGKEQARITLALLIFPDMNQSFTVAEDPAQMLQLPAFTEAEARAKQANPELAAAEAAAEAARTDVSEARAGYLPSLGFDLFYGIDANQFAVRSLTPEGVAIQNVGYSGLFSLSLPIFNWGATHSQVKQAEYHRQQAVTALSYAQRMLDADLAQFYLSAQEAKAEMSLRRQAADEATRSRDLTLIQYKAGINSALEVVNSESTLSVEETAYFDAETRYAIALANLATLTGSLSR